MEEQKKTAPAKEIDLVKVFVTLWNNRKQYFWALPITFVVSALLIVCVPRYYACQVTLVPETGAASAGGSLGSLASSFGFNIGSAGGGEDAIQPQLYPELMASPKFTTGMFGVEVETIDGDLKTTYYEYLLKHQKKAWWSTMFSIFSEEKEVSLEGLDVFRLTGEQDMMVKAIQQKISCNINKKTNVITISVQDQDPLIAATLADSVRVRLQKAITEYRTSKARIDLEFTEKLYSKAKADYDSIRQKYNAISDANVDVTLHSVKSKIDDVEKEMNLSYSVYSNLALQLQQSQAKLQEKTPAFTELQGASVPVKPAGPKRVIFVLAMMFVVGVAVSVRVLFQNRKELF